MKNVIRDESGEITHIYYTYVDGWKTFLTQADTDRLNDFSMADIESYYSGEAQDEFSSIKDDLLKVLNEEMSFKELKVKIGSQSGLIADTVIEMNI